MSKQENCVNIERMETGLYNDFFVNPFTSCKTDIIIYNAYTMRNTIVIMDLQLCMELSFLPRRYIYINPFPLSHSLFSSDAYQSYNAGHSYKIIAHNNTGPNEFVVWK